MQKNAIFSKKLSNLELWCLLTTYRKLCKFNWAFKKTTCIIGSLQSKMAEIRHLENRHASSFSAEGGPIWIKFRRLVQNDMSTAMMCGNGSQMYNSNIADVWANSMVCHPRATYHIAGCCHLVNSLSRFQSHMPHCRVQSPDEINVVIVPHCKV